MILFKVIIYAESILFHKIFNEDLEYISFLTKVKVLFKISGAIYSSLKWE